MTRTWRKRSGLLLIMMWVTARIVLPLEPRCPHHIALAPATSLARPTAPATSVGLVASHAGHAAHGASETSESSEGPHHSAPLSCDCAMQCCAAIVVALDPAPISVVPLVSLLVPQMNSRLAQQARPPREHPHLLHPPGTAPPPHSVFA